jgi:hypothetical protein
MERGGAEDERRAHGRSRWPAGGGTVGPRMSSCRRSPRRRRSALAREIVQHRTVSTGSITSLLQVSIGSFSSVLLATERGLQG